MAAAHPPQPDRRCPEPGWNKIRQAYSHPVALAQCRRFFVEHPEIEAAPFYDTAGSVKQLMELRDPAWRASPASRRPGITARRSWCPGIEDNAENYTRFFLIRKREQVRPQSRAQQGEPGVCRRESTGDAGGRPRGLCRNGNQFDPAGVQTGTGTALGVRFLCGLSVGGIQALPMKPLKRLPEHCSMVRELGRYRAAVPAA